MEKRGRTIAIVALAVLALWAASLLGGRYEIDSGINGSIVRLDRITGDMTACDLDGCWDVEKGRPL